MIKHRSGFALVTVLLLVILLVMIAIAFTQLIPKYRTTTESSRSQESLMVIADAGIKYAVEQFESDPDWIKVLENESLEQRYIDAEQGINGTYRIEISRELDDGSIEIKSTGWVTKYPDTTSEAKAIFSITEEITYEETVIETETTEIVEIE